MQIVAVNTGSSSLRIGAFMFTGDQLLQRRDWHLDQANAQWPSALCEDREPDWVVHRWVHSGGRFDAPIELGGHLELLEPLLPLAPLHNPKALDAIRTSMRLFPRARQLVVPDSGFFRDLPAVARRLPLSEALCRRHGLSRIGFHGIAHQYLSETWHLHNPRPPGAPPSRIVTLQLGSGCSVTALRDGAPIETSMGFSPWSGVVMSSRPGDLDPGVLIHLLRHTGMNADQLEATLRESSGLRGVSGSSGDMKTLLKTGNDEAASMAVELFLHALNQRVGAYVHLLQGVDGVAFGGGIGEHSSEIRRRILEPMRWLGVEWDESTHTASLRAPTRISTPASQVAVWVVPVDEARLLAIAALQQDQLHPPKPSATR